MVDARGRPGQPHRHDLLSKRYRRVRAAHAEAASSIGKERTRRARRRAAAIVAVHGPRLRIEEGNVSAWFRRWGSSCAAFTPGRLIRALDQECAASGGALLRVSTARTALSQHCLCGARVPKLLSQRIHTCPACGLTGDRDLVSAALAAFVTLGDPAHPAHLRVDYDRARLARGAYGQRLQAAVAESTVLRPQGATAARPTDPGPKRGTCRCSAKCRSLPRANPGREPRLTTGTSRAQTESHNGQNFWDGA